MPFVTDFEYALPAQVYMTLMDHYLATTRICFRVFCVSFVCPRPSMTTWRGRQPSNEHLIRVSVVALMEWVVAPSMEAFVRDLSSSIMDGAQNFILGTAQSCLWH